MTPFCRVRYPDYVRFGPDNKLEQVYAHGVLMSEAVYVPLERRWVCLVATASATKEMNPLDLTVTGVWVPGEPIEPEAT